MSPENALVAVPKEEKPQEVGTVTSENFTEFLFGFGIFPYNTWNFAEQLDLPFYTPFMQDLYDNKMQVDTMSDDERRKWTERYEKAGIEPTSDNHLHKQADAERGTTLYFDMETGAIHATEVRHGEYTRGKVDTLKVLSDTKIPMLEVHTHPASNLFSPADFQRLVLRGYSNGRSVVRGILVLCPDMQILALPTQNTPVLKSDKEVIDATTPYNEKIQQSSDSIEQHLVERGTKIGDIAERKAKAAEDNTQKSYTDLKSKFENGLISMEELEQYERELIEKYKEHVESLGDRLEKLCNEATGIFLGKQNRIVNALCLEFARALDVQLYSATDMHNFTKWTA